MLLELSGCLFFRRSRIDPDSLDIHFMTRNFTSLKSKLHASHKSLNIRSMRFPLDECFFLRYGNALMKTNREKASYCIGLETGKQLRHQFKEMDVEFLADGIRDGFSESSPKLAQEEINAVLNALRQQIESQQKQFIAKLAAENKKKGEEFLAQNQKQEGVVLLPSGLQYKVLTPGTGTTPTLLDVVKVHYRGYFIDGTEFESTYSRQKPQTFSISQVIPGWAEALQKMKVGDKWRLFIPSYLAYGEMGYGREIEPNTALIFDMELLAIGE